MSLPVCPRCDSGNVIPSPQSAGHNHCMTCGHIDVVVNFHQAPDPRYRRIPTIKTVLAESQRGNQTHKRRGQPMVVNGKTQRPVTQKQFWWDRD